MGVQSGKIEPIKIEPNRNRENGLDFVVPNKQDGFFLRNHSIWIWFGI